MPDFAPPVIGRELTERLGQIVISWSTLEYWISALLAHMLQADLGAMLLVSSNIAASTQSKWIGSLMSGHQHESQQNKRVAELLDRADDLRSERNESIHGVWDTTNCEPGTAEIQTINLDRPEIIRMRLVTVHDLDQLVIDR